MGQAFDSAQCCWANSEMASKTRGDEMTDLVEKEDRGYGEKDLEVRVATGAPPADEDEDWDPSEEGGGQGATIMTQAGRDQLEEMTEKMRTGVQAQELDAEAGLFYPMYGIPFNKLWSWGIFLETTRQRKMTYWSNSIPRSIRLYSSRKIGGHAAACVRQTLALACAKTSSSA